MVAISPGPLNWLSAAGEPGKYSINNYSMCKQYCLPFVFPPEKQTGDVLGIVTASLVILA